MVPPDWLVTEPPAVRNTPAPVVALPLIEPLLSTVSALPKPQTASAPVIVPADWLVTAPPAPSLTPAGLVRGLRMLPSLTTVAAR